MTNREGSPGSELSLDGQAREVPVPYDGGSEYQCPSCERRIPNRIQIRMGKPPRFEHVLNDIFKCPYCKFIFSPKTHAHVVRQ